MVSISDIDAFQAGTSIVDFGVHVVNSARNETCALFKNYSGAFIPNPADDFVQGIWSGFCANSPSGLPPQPTSPFSGGQCPVQYSVTMTYTLATSLGTFHINDVSNPYGPLSSIVADSDSDPTGSCRGYHISGTDGSGNLKDYYGSRGGGAPYTVSDFVIVSITPVVAGSDTCGDPPPKYPIVPLPPNGNKISITVPVAGGSITNVIGGIVELPGSNVNIAPNINLNANIGSLLGPINISVDLGGIHVNPGDSPGLSPFDLADALVSFGNNVVRTPAPPPDSTTHNITPPSDPPGNGAKKDGLTGLDYVTISLTTIPISARVQFGNGSAPNVFVGAGWLEFSGEGTYYPRQSIQFMTSSFKAPEGVNGYSYTLSVGFLGQDTAYQRKAST